MFDFLQVNGTPDRARAGRRSRLVRVIALAMALAAALSWAASAEAHRLRPGLRSFAPSQRALAQALAQSTGLAPSQVTTQDICGVAKPGYARCAAQAVVLRRNHALVRPHARHQATLGRVRQAFTPGFVTPAAAPGTAPGASTPAYLQQAYDLTYLSQTQGATDTIAIVDAYNNPNAESDLATYRSTFGLPACSTANGCFRKVNQTGGSTPPPTHDASWAEEESLDLDAVSALCPKCHILLVEAKTASVGDLDTAQIEAASLGANQISDSWTFAVSGGILGGTYVFPGISTVAATGDTGYLGNNSDNFPAAFSSVTAAGGTSLAAAGGGNPRGFSEGAWSLSGNMGGSSGCDLNVVKPSYQTDTGCFQRASGRTWGRAYADLSADADPATGLTIFDSEKGDWELIGGTSLSAPLIAAYYAITGVNSTTPQWAYSASTLLNDPISGSSGTCSIHYLCNAGPGYDGPTGVGSISGAVATGAPGIGGPANGTGGTSTYTQSTRPHGATIEGGIYPNGLDTKWWIEYSTDSSFDHASYVTDIGAGTAPVSVTGYLSHLTPGTTYHYHLVAQNSVGTTYGYDYTFTTPQASPSDPTASISAPSTATPGSVMFDASGSGSNDPQDSITDYTWDFGDGHTADSPSAVVSHTYAPGVYNVTLIVTDSNGDSDSTSQTITIDHLVASFTAPRIVAPGSTVSFDSSGSSDLLGPITDYSWDFGDGTTSDAGNNPTTTHPYPNRGNYVVMLTVTNKLGQTATTTQTVTVDVPPTASLAAPTGAQTPGSSLSFDASGSTPGPGGTITDYRFDFGDNSTPDDTQTTPNDTHTYANPGHPT
ncbi:MAG: PKD domain-containing protein, partial [Solirubrobacteraceae bacterium]